MAAIVHNLSIFQRTRKEKQAKRASAKHKGVGQGGERKDSVSTPYPI